MVDTLVRPQGGGQAAQVGGGGPVRKGLAVAGEEARELLRGALSERVGEGVEAVHGPDPTGRRGPRSRRWEGPVGVGHRGALLGPGSGGCW